MYWGGVLIPPAIAALLLAIHYSRQMLGIAMMFAALPNLVIEDAPRERTSEATGVLSVIRQFAGSIGTQVIGYTLATSTIADRAGGAPRYSTNEAFTLTLGFVALACVLSVVVITLIPKPAATVHVAR